MTEKKRKLESLIRFHNTIKVKNYNRGGKKEKKIRKNLQSKSKQKDNGCFSWVTAVRVLSLTGSHRPPHLPRMSSNTVLVFGPAVKAAQVLFFFFFLAAQVLIWSYSCVFLSTMSTAIRTSAYSLVGAQWLFIYSLDRVCQVNYVDLICKLYSWWEGFGSSSITTLPLAFNCGFISTSACGLTLGFAPETAPVRDECEGGIAAWLVRTLTCQVCRDMDCPHHRSYGPLRVFLLAFL